MNATTLQKVCGVAAGLLIASAASAQVASAIIQEDKPLPDQDEMFLISSINGPQVNGAGGVIWGVNTDDGNGTLSNFFGNTAGGANGTIRTEGTIAGFVQNSFEGFYGLADDGSIGYSPSADAVGGVTGLDGVWINDTPVAVEEDMIPGNVTFPFVSFGSRPTMTYSGQLWWVGGETDTQGGSTDIRALYANSTTTPVVSQGDAVTGLADAVDGIDFDFAVSESGTNWINQLMTDTGSSTDDGHVVINNAVLNLGGNNVSEGTAVPASVGGIGGENWDNFDFFAINDAGDYFFTGDTDGDAATDEFINHNGQMILRQGDSISTITGGTAVLDGSIEDLAANSTNDYAAVWDIEDGTGDIEALILNGELLLAEGDAVDWNNDGVIDVNDGGAVIDNFTGLGAIVELSERRLDGSFDVYFTADVNLDNGNTLEGAFTITIPTPGATGLLSLAGLAAIRRRR